MHDHGVVMAVDVRVDAVQALEELADDGGEVLGKGDADAGGEGGFVVDVGLHPRHQVLDVLGRGHLGGFFERGAVLPEVLELVGCFHFGAASRGAEFGDGAVEEVDLIVEVDD